jgi:hypothetical protein
MIKGSNSRLRHIPWTPALVLKRTHGSLKLRIGGLNQQRHSDNTGLMLTHAPKRRMGVMVIVMMTMMMIMMMMMMMGEMM